MNSSAESVALSTPSAKLAELLRPPKQLSCGGVAVLSIVAYEQPMTANFLRFRQWGSGYQEVY